MGSGCRKALLVMLAIALAVSPAAAARSRGKESFKPKDWIGRPAGDLIAVMGQPEDEREARKGTLLVWRRYPIQPPDVRDTTISARSTDPESALDPPPIPGDPTLDGMQVIECTALVGSTGVITRIHMPGECRVPAPIPAGDDEDGGQEKRPELPRSRPPGPR